MDNKKKNYKNLFKHLFLSEKFHFGYYRWN